MKKKKKTKTYTARPPVPLSLRDRFLAVMEVFSGQTSVSEAARRLGMSRNHFQTLMHRAQQGMIEGLTPGQAGRPSKAPREAELEQQVEKLQAQIDHLHKRSEMSERLMGLASQFLHGTTHRARRARRKTATATSGNDDPEDPVPIRKLAHQLNELGLPRELAAHCLDISKTTLHRWLNMERKRLVSRRKEVSAQAVAAAIDDVRALRGLVGAQALSRAHPELSRRQAAAIKRQTMTAIERERREACARVIVTKAGIMRGFDAIDLGHDRHPRYVLVASDASVPFRTTLRAAERYDGVTVEHALAIDFEQHGAPLVLRLDRARAHSTPAMTKMLADRGVTVLHGPARYAPFYGQLERQNREHGAWLKHAFATDEEPLEELLERMKYALNERWPRRTLAWKTSSDAWNVRPDLALDRQLWRTTVLSHAAHLAQRALHPVTDSRLAMRLAIEHELGKLGYLRIEKGGPC